MALIERFMAWLGSVLGWQETPHEPLPAPVVVPEPVISPKPTPMPSTPAPKPNPDVLLPWIFGKRLTHNNWHNVRVLCDLEGLSSALKEELCATVWGESEFSTSAKCFNYAFNSAGVKYLSSTDSGICQWNDHYHGTEISAHDAEFNPEKAVRLMCRYFKAGRQNQWVAHSSGRYKQFLGRKL